MTSKPILELPSVSGGLTGNEQIPLVQGGATKRASVNDILFTVSGGFVPNYRQIFAGTGLSGGGPMSSDVTLLIADTGTGTGTYGDSITVPQITVNAQGQITAVTNVAISFSGLTVVASVTGTANEIVTTGTSNVIVGLASTLYFAGKTVSSGEFNVSTINGATISGSTLQAPTISGPVVSGGSFNNPTISGGTITGAVINGPTISGGTIANLTLNNPTISGGTIRGSTINGATISGSTLQGPTVSGGTFSGGTFNNPTVSGGAFSGPVLTSPVLGTPASGTMTNVTGLPLTTGVTGILPSANGGTSSAFFLVSGLSASIKTFSYPNKDDAVAVLDNAQNFTKAQRGGVVTLTASGIDFTPNFTSSNNFRATVSGAMRLQNPTGVVEGQSGMIVFTANGGGTAAITYSGTFWTFAAAARPSIGTTSGAVSALGYFADTSTRIVGSLNASIG